MDPRITKLAKVLVHYSLKLKKGQVLKIIGEVPGLPLVTAAYQEAIEVGALPYTMIKVPENEEYLMKKGNQKQVEFIPPFAKVEVNKMDAMLAIWGTQNTRQMSGSDPKKQALQRKAMQPLFTKIFKRHAAGEMRWVGTQFPTLADAQEADMSLADYEDFVYKAGHIHAADPVKHWKKVAKEQNRLVKILNRFKEIHVQAPDTDVKLNVKGRKWINCAGTENFPDGEIFTSPIENSAQGVIRYTFPAVYSGRQVEDVRLEFKNGKIVNESAGKNKKFLTAMLDMDKGARFLGEFAIGTNYEIKQFTSNTLFDEKIGGTCHLAAGASIPEAGGVNKSGLHWDMVCDLKKGEIKADGKVIYSKGKFRI